MQNCHLLARRCYTTSLVLDYTGFVFFHLTECTRNTENCEEVKNQEWVINKIKELLPVPGELVILSFDKNIFTSVFMNAIDGNKF